MSLCSLIVFSLFLKELAKITSHHKNRNVYDIFQYQYMYMHNRPCTHIVFILQCQKAQNNSQIVYKEQRHGSFLLCLDGVLLKFGLIL